MRYALDVQYIGKNYAGSQIQFENGKETEIPTIQGELEKAICTLIESKTQINKRPIRTIFSGRTDRGVNAIAQVIHFDTDKEYTVKISITDRLTTVSYTFDIPTGKALIWKDLANKRVGINKKPTEALDIQGNVKVSGTINTFTLDNVCELGYIVIDTW